MDFLRLVKRRRSIRQYCKKPIPKDALKDLIDAARFAPTARNIQPWEFVVVTEQAMLRKIADLAENGRFIAAAGACIAVFCTDTKYYLEDGCAATENILIMATAKGLASCWVAGDKKPYCGQVNELLNANSSYKLVSLIALGYPESEKAFSPADKRGLDEVIHWQRM